MPIPFIQIQNLRKSYREGDKTRLIFENLNLHIQQGEFAVLLGRSGSGKSTLLNLISGIDLPDEGQVHINGCAITTLGERERTLFRRRHIGFIFQFFNLIQTLTVEENVLLPLQLNNQIDPYNIQQAMDLLRQVDLDRRRNSFPEQLSGGEQQRLAIARALVHNPSLLLADEPTGNLDAETGAHVMELLLKLHRQSNTTAIMVTHSREMASQADRILRLKAGRISAETV